jgi:hypothetical protein
MTPTPGDITHRIGPSVPSPPYRPDPTPLPSPARRIGPGPLVDPGSSSISRLARTTSILEYDRSLQGRYACPLGYGL